jgi:hypothetical protein
MKTTTSNKYNNNIVSFGNQNLWKQEFTVVGHQNTNVDYVEVHEHKLRAKPSIANKK